MEGCSAPLVVKFADTQREKDQKKIHQMQSSLLNISSAGSGNGMHVSLGQSATAMSSPPLITNPPPQANPFIGADAAISPSSLQLLHQLQAVGLQQHLMQGLLIYIIIIHFIYLLIFFNLNHFQRGSKMYMQNSNLYPLKMYILRIILKFIYLFFFFIFQ